VFNDIALAADLDKNNNDIKDTRELQVKRNDIFFGHYRDFFQN
jgi:hypothetical protein